MLFSIPASKFYSLSNTKFQKRLPLNLRLLPFKCVQYKQRENISNVDLYWMLDMFYFLYFAFAHHVTLYCWIDQIDVLEIDVLTIIFRSKNFYSLKCSLQIAIISTPKKFDILSFVFFFLSWLWYFCRRSDGHQHSTKIKSFA